MWMQKLIKKCYFNKITLTSKCIKVSCQNQLKNNEMKIDHIAIWVNDLELVKNFYTTYFNMSYGEKYINETKGFSSYFLSFENSETRMEIMHRPDISEHSGKKGLVNGITHLALSVGSKADVDKLTEKLRLDGYTIASEPRTTGDGYYESVILDPEGNHIEITE